VNEVATGGVRRISIVVVTALKQTLYISDVPYKIEQTMGENYLFWKKSVVRSKLLSVAQDCHRLKETGNAVKKKEKFLVEAQVEARELGPRSFHPPRSPQDLLRHSSQQALEPPTILQPISEKRYDKDILT